MIGGFALGTVAERGGISLKAKSPVTWEVKTTLGRSRLLELGGGGSEARCRGGRSGEHVPLYSGPLQSPRRPNSGAPDAHQVYHARERLSLPVPVVSLYKTEFKTRPP